jgi:hypothetical protein
MDIHQIVEELPLGLSNQEENCLDAFCVGATLQIILFRFDGFNSTCRIGLGIIKNHYKSNKY